MRTTVRDQKSIWKEFGPWLRRQREMSGKQRKWVADEIGIHPVQLARIETGESGTRKDTLDALIACLGLNAEETYIRAGLWPKSIEEIEREKKIKETIEEALDNAMFFDRKGLSESDKAKLRPLLEVADREVERLREKKQSVKVSR